jgi:hypothetical protein
MVVIVKLLVLYNVTDDNALGVSIYEDQGLNGRT